MLTPNHVVAFARAWLLAGSLTAAALMLGPFSTLETVVGLTDKEAHVLAFGGLCALSFMAFPRMRRSDLAIAALMLGASVEVAQLLTGRSASLTDLAADLGGIAFVYAVSQIEVLRALARSQGQTSFAELAANDPRRARAEASPVSTQPSRFADRAAAHFPARSVDPRAPRA